MKNRVLWIVAAIILSLLCYVGVATAATIDSGNCGTNLTWSLDDTGTLMINGSGEFYEFCMSEDTPWYPYIESITDVVISYGATSISPYTFSGCINLTNVSIPSSVTEIGAWAFNFCKSLPNITIPNSITRIGRGAFTYCIELAEITIPNSVTYIDAYAFDQCRKLTNIVIPENVTYIGDHAFTQCTGLASITLPSNITKIENGTFSTCQSLARITIPDRVQSIGDYAFSNCSSLSSITIPESVSNIGWSAFYSCYSLSEIHISDLASWVNISYPDDMDSHPNTNHEWQLFIGDTKVNKAVIPEGITSICSYAFMYCSSLTNVVLPKSITSIGESAFSGCSGLSNITIPSNVVQIGSYAFNINNHPLEIAFAVSDDAKEIEFGFNWIDASSSITIYCHRFTSPHSWCVNNSITPVFFENIDITDILVVNFDNSISIACGETRVINYGVFPLMDDIEIEWSSSDQSLLSVSGGIVTAHKPGTAIVTATIGTISATVSIDCYIPITDFQLSADELWVLAMDDVELNVKTVFPDNASGDFSWTSSNTNLAIVDNTGLVTTIKPGDVTITALSDTGISKSCKLHLCYPVTAINLFSPAESILVGNDLQLTAHVTMNTQSCTNQLVSFTSSDESIATVDIETGVVHGVSPGFVTITASSRSDESDSVTIKVDFDMAGLNVLHLPSDLKVINEEAFARSACEAVIIPEGCETIGKKAFSRCEHLLYVYIPSTVTTIETDAFENCGNIVFEYGNGSDP